jgi:hypothetical protein
MRGAESQSYDLLFTVTGPELFGNGVDSRSMSRAVDVQACEPGETFDDKRLECACADGFGLVVADNTCRTCEANGQWAVARGLLSWRSTDCAPFALQRWCRPATCPAPSAPR